MKVETHLQNQLRSNGNLERYVSVHLGEIIAALRTFAFIYVPFTFFFFFFFLIEAASSPFHPLPTFLYM